METRGARYEVMLTSAEVLDTLKISRYFFAPAIETLVDDEEAIKLHQSLFRQRGKLTHISSKLGELASAFKINAKYWHTANADVEMMLGVLLKITKFLEKHRNVDIHKNQEKAIARDVKQHGGVTNTKHTGKF